MSLPTLQPYFITRPRTREGMFVQRKLQEDDRQRQWAGHSHYFNSQFAHNRIREAWTSDKRDSERMACNSQHLKEKRTRGLQERREKLRVLLEEEREEMEREMKCLSGDKMSVMKDRAEELKSAREQRRLELAEERLREHWRGNCPELRELESQQLEQATHQKWASQVHSKREMMERERRKKEDYERDLERERVIALQMEEKEQSRKKRDEVCRAEVLRQQMMEVKAREEEAAVLEQQHAMLTREQDKLDRAERERREFESRQKKLEFGRLLVRQARAQLRRRCQQVQEALEFDLKILQQLEAQEQEQHALKTARREKAESDAQWMRQVVQEQLQLERQREAEMDLLYQEEAARMWTKREAEWDREKRAREKLMAQVLAERQEQLHERMEELRIKQINTIEERESVLREMELTNRLSAQERREKRVQEAKRKEELVEQMAERRMQEEAACLQKEEELARQRQADEAYAEVLQEERQRLTARGYQQHHYWKTKP